MNYLGNAADCVMGRVGFRNNTPTRHALQGQGGDNVDDHNDDEYSYVSRLSAPGTTNLLATRTGANQRGEWGHPGQLQRGGPNPQREQGGIPNEVDSNDNADVQSNVTGVGGGGDQGTAFEGGQPQNEPTQGPRQGPGGAIAAHLEKIKDRQADAVIGRELDWQGRVEGDQAKSVAFRDQAVNQTTFRAFAFMKGRSPVVHMAHSVGKFFGMSGMAADVQGKYIGFIGDRGNGRHPVPFILPPQNAWAWTKIKFLNERNNFENHFEERGNWDQLWTTEADDDALTEKTLPRLLALPAFVAEYIQAQGGTCLPYHLYMYIRDHLNGDTTIDPER